MSPTAPAPSSRTIPSAETVPADRLRKNPWNPNRMTSSMMAKVAESIELYGFVDPLTVREVGMQDYQILDGEHRFDVGLAGGMTEFPVINLGLLDDASAKKLTIILNELHGQADPDKMGDLLADILKDSSIDELLKAMPYDESMLAGFLQTELPSLPPLPSPTKTAGAAPDKTVWAERLYRMPKEVAIVVDEAIEKAKDGEEIEQWQALERICADYLAS